MHDIFPFKLACYLVLSVNKSISINLPKYLMNIFYVTWSDLSKISVLREKWAFCIKMRNEITQCSAGRLFSAEYRLVFSCMSSSHSLSCYATQQ